MSVCVQGRVGAAGPGEATPRGDGKESESSVLRHGGTVCPARPHAPAHEGQVGERRHGVALVIIRLSSLRSRQSGRL